MASRNVEKTWKEILPSNENSTSLRLGSLSRSERSRRIPFSFSLKTSLGFVQPRYSRLFVEVGLTLGNDEQSFEFNNTKQFCTLAPRKSIACFIFLAVDNRGGKKKMAGRGKPRKHRDYGFREPRRSTETTSSLEASFTCVCFSNVLIYDCRRFFRS